MGWKNYNVVLPAAMWNGRNVYLIMR